MFSVGELNLWAVLVAWLINMFLGAFWYSPSGFSKSWTKHTGVDIMKIPQNKATKILGFVALSALVQAVSLALVLKSLGVISVQEAIVAAVLLWLGFVAATTVGTTLYQKRSWSFLWLNSSYFLIVMVINSVLLTVWK